MYDYTNKGLIYKKIKSGELDFTPIPLNLFI